VNTARADGRLLSLQLRLLERAVRHYAKNEDPARVKIPWKKVGEWIVENGGSYHFGNATCRKKWDEMVAARRV
jgi:hypothetical protein